MANILVRNELDYHAVIIAFLKIIGYPDLNGGCCHGFSLRWLEACFLGEEEPFNRRMESIVTADEDLCATLNLVRKSDWKNTPDPCPEIFEILAFFDSLMLFQYPEKYYSVFSNALSQIDIEQIAGVASSDRIRSLEGLVKIYSQSGIYTAFELQNHLNAMSGSMEFFELPYGVYGVLLSTLNHTVAMTYTRGRGWVFMDINQYPAKQLERFETQQLEKLIRKAFFVDEMTACVAFSASVYTIGVNQTFLSKFSQVFNQLEKQVINAEIVNRNASGLNLTALAVLHNDSELLTELVLHGADLSQLFQEGFSLPYIAASHGHTKILEKLDEYNADLEQKSVHGHHLVHAAASYGYEEVIQTAGNLGLNLAIQDNEGRTPLHFAAIQGHVSTVFKLVGYGVDLNSLDALGFSPLHHAVGYAHSQVVIVLIEAGADLNQFTSSGVTPVYIAVVHGYDHLLVELLKRGADFERSQSKLTPVFIATLYNHLSVLQVLKKWGVSLKQSYGFLKNELVGLVADESDEVKARMLSWIKRWQDAVEISITLPQLAKIMGHQEIELFFRERHDKKRHQRERFFVDEPDAKRTKTQLKSDGFYSKTSSF